MSCEREISVNVQEVWSKLNGRWQGPHADAFHREHIVRITETTEAFEDACADLVSLADSALKEMQIIEQNLANQ